MHLREAVKDFFYKIGVDKKKRAKRRNFLRRKRKETGETRRDKKKRKDKGYPTPTTGLSSLVFPLWCVLLQALVRMRTTQQHLARSMQGVIIALFVFLGLFISQRVDSQSLYPPHSDITDVWVTKFDLKDMDEKDICNLLLFIGNNFDGTDDLVTAPNCTDCGPIIYAVPQTTERSDLFRDRDVGKIYLLALSFLFSDILHIFFFQTYHAKTWDTTQTHFPSSLLSLYQLFHTLPSYLRLFFLLSLCL